MLAHKAPSLSPTPKLANIAFQTNNFMTIIFGLIVVGSLLLLLGYAIRRRE